METLAHELVQCITRQRHLYQRLLDLFLDERTALLASDLEALNTVVAAKESLLQEIRLAEVKRLKSADRLAAALGLDSDQPPTVNSLGDRLEAVSAQRLKQAGEALQRLVATIQVESDRNRSLCLHALQFVNGSLKLLTNLVCPETVYHSSGRMDLDRSSGRVLSGAV
jgi:flagellar biosynthesis/type III secretory pathway chaperone